MLKLTRFEMHKLIRQKSFYICIGVFIAMLVFSAYTAQLSLEESGLTDPTFNGMNYMFDAAGGSVLTMVLGVFIPLFICEDFTSGTIRNIVTRGYTRLGIFCAKLIAVLIASVLMTVIGMAAAYAIGTAFWGAGDASFGAEQVKILLCQLAVSAGIATLFFAVSIVLQKTGGAIAVCLVLPMVLTIVLNLADAALAEEEIKLSSYWLERIAGTLGEYTVESDVIKKSLLTSAGYFAATVVASWLAVMKREY